MKERGIGRQEGMMLDEREDGLGYPVRLQWEVFCGALGTLAMIQVSTAWFWLMIKTIKDGIITVTVVSACFTQYARKYRGKLISLC